MLKQHTDCGFSLIESLTLIVVVAILLAGGFVLWHKGQRSDIDKRADTKTTQQKQLSDTETSKQSDLYAGWKSYASSAYRISFKYPTEWKVQESPLSADNSVNKSEYEINLQWNQEVKYNGAISIEVLDEDLETAADFYDSSINPSMSITKTTEKFKNQQSVHYKRSDPRQTERRLIAVGTKTYVISSVDTALNQEAGDDYWVKFDMVVNSLNVK